MELSRYTKIIPRAHDYLILNFVSGSVLALDKAKGEKIIKNSFSELDHRDIEFLLDRLILVEEPGDDYDIYNAQRNIKRYSDKSIHCVLIPTYACNFDCPYCYQHNLFEELNANAASQKWFDNLLVFFSHEIYKRSTLHIEWFGGEPTLYLKQIAAFNYKIKSICEQEECRLTMSMITNGYLLTPENANMLVKSGVNSFMITIDGLEQTHNSRRYLRGGGATYNQILSNIANLSNIAKINVRINIDTQSVDEVVEMFTNIEEIAGTPENVSIVMAPVFGSSVHRERAFFEDVAEIIDRLKGTRLKYDIRGAFLSSSNCKAGNLGHYAIDGRYNVYKCVSMAGNPACADGILNTQTNRIEYNDRALRFLSYSSTSNPNCMQCEYLPVCGNLCPLKEHKSLIPEGSESCTGCGIHALNCKEEIEKKLQAFISYISK